VPLADETLPFSARLLLSCTGRLAERHLLIIEVFSPMTEGRDRGTKWAHYRTIPSLREYVLVAQDKVGVERFVRQGDEWLYSAIDQRDGVLEFASLGVTVPVREIYDAVHLTVERTAMLIPPVDLMR